MVGKGRVLHFLIKKYCSINEESKSLLGLAIDKLGMSARAYDKIIKVSRTISDLEGSSSIETSLISPKQFSIEVWIGGWRFSS